MKHLKKSATVLLAFILAFSMCPIVPSSALAADDQPATSVNAGSEPVVQPEGQGGGSNGNTPAGNESNIPTNNATNNAPSTDPENAQQTQTPSENSSTPEQGIEEPVDNAPATEKGGDKEADTPEEPSPWQKLQTAIDDAEGSATIALEADYTAESDDASLTIPAGKNITLDLAGHMLNRNLESSIEGGHAIEVLGTLTVVDSTVAEGGAGAGAITGGNAQNGGGIIVAAGGTLNLESGAVRGNAAENGGGIYVDNGATLNLSGGAVQGNTASASGGGVLVASGASAVRVQGAPVVQGNAGATGADMYLPADVALTLSAPLATGAKLGVSLDSDIGVFTKGYAANNGEEDPSTYFTAADGFALEVSDGEANLVAAESGMLVAQGGADGGISVQDANDWELLQAAINSSTDAAPFKLEKDYVAGDGDVSLKITDEKSHAIDLNGHTINRNLTEQNDDQGHVFDVNNGTLTITDSSNGDGTIEGGYAENGGGIVIGGHGHVIFNSGTIKENQAYNGGGIYVYGGGQLEMTGGTVTENTGGDCGGVYNNGGTIILTDVTITDNRTRGAGGAGVNNKGTATLTRCAISRNVADQSGGGIYNNGSSLTLTGCTINNNTANGDGGGLCSYSSATLTDCTMSGNTAKAWGGAIRVRNKNVTVNVNGGSITDNTANGLGGAICVTDDGTLDLKQSEIKANTAYEGGGGIWVASSASAINVGSGVVVKENVANNIFLASDKKIHVSEQLAAGTEVGVAMESISGTFTENYKNTNESSEPDLFFVAEPGFSIAKDSSGEAKVIASNWTLLQKKINDANSGDTIKLDTDYLGVDENVALNIPAGKTITIDLDGHKIDRRRSSYTADGHVITVNGHLIVTDRANSTTGTITGGNGDCGGIRVEGADSSFKLLKGNISGNRAKVGGGGIRVCDGAQLEITGGSISDNSSEAQGGGIYTSGTVTYADATVSNNSSSKEGGGIYIEKGSVTIASGATAAVEAISSNKAQTNGGGIYVADGTLVIEHGSALAKIGHNVASVNGGGLYIAGGTATMNAGEISNNTAANNKDYADPNEGMGGGVYLAAGTLNLNGGVITKNDSAFDGGGVFVVGGSTFNVQGAPRVTGNTATVGRNILLAANPDESKPYGVITIAGTLTTGDSGALLDVLTRDHAKPLTSGYTSHSCDMGCFTTNDTDNSHLEVRDNELYISNSDAHIWVSSWEQLDNEIKKDNRGKVIGLSKDVVADDDDDCLKVDIDGEITIELNGYTINRNLEESEGGNGHAFNVRDDSTLNLRDSIGTGAITGGVADVGGAIFIADDATVNITNVAITNNYTNDTTYAGGGGILVEGVLNMTGGSISRNVCVSSGGGIHARDGSKVSLTGVTISHNACEHDGGGINTLGKGEDAVYLKSCVIKDNFCYRNGAGIHLYYESSCMVKLEDTDIVGNECREAHGDNVGAGIHVEDGRVDMKGGSISGNKGKTGAGIFNDNCAITLNGVTISKNTATDGDGGGIYIKDKGTAGIVNCTFSENEAHENGGGIYADKKTKRLELDGCTFTGNKGVMGGGLYAGGTTTIKGATKVDQNEATQNGGGIYVNKDTTISFDGSAKIEVTDNRAAANGGGVWVSEDADDVNVSGEVDVLSNAANNDFFLEEDKKINITGALTNTQMRVILGNGTGTFTSGFPGTNSGKDPGDFFLAQEGYAVIPDGNGEGQVVASDWSLLQRKINETPNEGTLKLEGELDRDWKAAPENSALYIASGKTITIDLNGHTIDRARTGHSEGGEVFTVDGALTFIDTKQGGTGRITGGYGNGGGVVVNDRGTLTLNGGTISGNKAKTGGGVLVNAGGQVVVNGGTITANHADNGGGVFSNGTATVTGGSITANEAVDSAGGIGFTPSSVLSVSGLPNVTGNLAPVGKNVLIPGNDGSGHSGAINVAGKLNADAKIDVVTQGANNALTRGLANGELTDSQALSVFTYNGAGDKLELRDPGHELFLKATQADVTVSDWQALQNAINDGANQGKVIALANDITAGEVDKRLLLEGKNVTIDLNGHQLNRNLDDSDSDGHVFELSGNSTLTIRDSAGTGRITGGYAKHGGAINIHEGSICNIEGGAITGNRASDEGGAIYVYGTLNMTGGVIARNSAESGGAIFVDENGFITLNGIALTNNEATKWGGGAINNKGNATLASCVMRDNKAGNEGGAIYNGEKQLTLIDCTIAENSAPAGGGICCFGTVTMQNTTVTSNHASDAGGGINAHGALTITGGEISGNTGGDAGGIYNSGGTITVENTKISGNWGSGGGALNNKRGTATLTGCTIQANSAGNEGGALYIGSGSDNTTLESCTLDANHAGGDGGGINAYGPAAINNCTFTNNKADHAGGALLVHGSTTTVTNVTMKDNEAITLGGGAYVNDDATLNLIGGTITANTATEGGAGVWMSGNSNLNIQGALTVVDNNGGSDIYVASGRKIGVTGALQKTGDAPMVGVYTPDGVGKVFTSGFLANNPNLNPAEYFKSNNGYTVFLDGAEASTKQLEIDKDPFVDQAIQVNPNYNELSGNNWMSGIAGGRYLNEINLPGTHDSGTKHVVGNVSTGNLSDYAIIAGFIVLGPLVLPNVVADYCAKFAKCQDRYIDEQLEDGIRSLDIRLDTYYSEPGYPANKHDNGEDLYILHGKEKITGSYFAQDHDGNWLTFDKVLEWCTEFLKKHPTETIIMSVQIDSVDDVYDEGMARIVKHLRELEGKVNPSTGKSYLYLEDGVFGKRYSGYPQLKDCRGQIVLQCGDSDANILGGLVKGAGLDHVDGPEGDYHDNAEAKIFNLTNFYADHSLENLPADVRQHLNYYYSVGTNGTDTRIPPRTKPLDIADDVLDAMFGDNGLIVDKVGKFLGLINMDGEDARVSKIVWASNFFSALEYRNVTVKSGISEADTKVYTVPYGTRIPIPECVYTKPGEYFDYWEGYNGYSTWHSNPGESWVVTADTTFTAQWSTTAKTPVTVLWRDGENADNLRPTQLTVKVGDNAYVIKAEENWRFSIPLDVRPENLRVDWEKIGDEDETGKYVCNVRARGVGNGIIIELTHTPRTETIKVEGTVNWVDNNNADGKRPENVTLELLADGSPVESKIVEAKDGWKFDFGTQYAYREGEKVTYTVNEKDVDGYSHYVKGFDVTNVRRNSRSGKELTGMIIWADNNNEDRKRPESVTVKLLQNGTEVASQEVTGDTAGTWPLSIAIPSDADLAQYTVSQDTVDGYEAPVIHGMDESGGILMIVNTIEAHDHTYASITMPIMSATCTQDGSQMVMEYCTECGYVKSREQQTLPALGHDWGLWHTVKEATSDKAGQEARTCARCGHEQTRVVPKRNHVHTLQKVEAKAATCTEDGNIEYWKCTEGNDPCGLYFRDADGKDWIHQEATLVHATGHNWGDWTVVQEPTEFLPGIEKRVCANDARHVELRIVPKKGHVHGLTHVEAKAATCTEDGNIEYWQCTEGSDSCRLYFKDEAAKQWVHEEGVVVHATGHDWGEWRTIRPATDTERGLERRVCKNNPTHVQERDIPKVGHVHSFTHVEAKAPTCTEAGNIEYWHCEECSLYYRDPSGVECITKEDTVIPALGHEWGEATYEWSADDTKVTATHVCLRDPSYSESETVDTITVPTVPPTCTEPGKSLIMTKLFEGSGFMPQAKQGPAIPALGHDWGEWVVVTPATETSEGLEQRTCARCGEVETRAIPAAIAYRYVGADGTSWTRGSSDVLSLTFKRSLADETTFSHFTGIEVDGVAVSATDASGRANYTAVSGSVVVALQPAYLETLSDGDHEMKALFDDGSAQATFTVKPAPAATKAAMAKTGDTLPIVAIIVVALLAAAALVALLVARRKRQK